jgi:hypothetical protein
MWEERPSFEVAPLRTRLALDRGIWTEVIVRRLHRPALVSLAGRRIADYLASELRGQLLARSVDVVVHDRMTRGLGQKVRHVEPVRFQGVRLELPEEVVVPGHGPSMDRAPVFQIPPSSRTCTASGARGSSTGAGR